MSLRLGCTHLEVPRYLIFVLFYTVNIHRINVLGFIKHRKRLSTGLSHAVWERLHGLFPVLLTVRNMFACYKRRREAKAWSWKENWDQGLFFYRMVKYRRYCSLTGVQPFHWRWATMSFCFCLSHTSTAVEFTEILGTVRSFTFWPLVAK